MIKQSELEQAIKYEHEYQRTIMKENKSVDLIYALEIPGMLKYEFARIISVLCDPLKSRMDVEDVFELAVRILRFNNIEVDYEHRKNKKTN